MSPPSTAAAFNGFDVARQAWHLLMNNRGVLLIAGAAGLLLLVMPSLVTLAVGLVAVPLVLASTLQEALVPYVMGSVVIGGIVVGTLFVVGGTMAAQVIGIAQADRGQTPDVGDALTAALRRAPRLVLLTLAVGFVVGLGFVAFVVPGFIALSCFFVALPAAVLEDRGVFDSMSRSLALTRGYRWRLFSAWFGISIVVSIFAAMVEAILTALALSLTFGLLQFAFFILWNAWNANYVALTFLRLRALND